MFIEGARRTAASLEQEFEVEIVLSCSDDLQMCPAGQGLLLPDHRDWKFMREGNNLLFHNPDRDTFPTGWAIVGGPFPFRSSLSTDKKARRSIKYGAGEGSSCGSE